MDIKLNEKLPLDILFLIRVKAHEFKKEGIHTIDINDIESYLFEVRWKNKEELSMCEVIDDIMTLNFSTVFDYLKVRVIKEANTLKLDDFKDLISK
jgi:hypothetical protein